MMCQRDVLCTKGDSSTADKWTTLGAPGGSGGMTALHNGLVPGWVSLCNTSGENKNV